MLSRKTTRNPRIIPILTALAIFISIFAMLNVSATDECEYCGQDPCITPVGYHCNDYQKLVAFALQGDNLNKLGWDLANPESWGFLNPLTGTSDVTWNSAEQKRVTHINISNKALTGTLEVSDFTALSTLNANINQLTSINASNSNLIRLEAGANQLTAIVLSGNANLEELYVSANQLTTLDVSSNTALTHLLVHGNRLTTLDVSNNAALLSLGVSDNRLTALDVNAALSQLYVQNNQLRILDVSSNTQLGMLNVSNNRLTDISSLEDLTNLTAVIVSYNLLNLQSAKVQASIEKIQATVDGNDGIFEYTPQKCLACKSYPCICDGNHDDVQSGGNSARDAIINGFGIGGEAGSVNNSGKTEISGHFENDTYIKHSEIPLVYTADKNFADFREVRINGRRLTKGTHYTVKSGSTIITLLPEYLDTLEAGEHELSVHFSGLAVVRDSFTVEDAEYDDVSTLAGILGEFDSIDN
ncbi:MAG: hypothetical protein FWG90_03735 [Oscillospiraceae bacterium]|nr:hypothetical protein [Oscillospiraceae bacterium]